MKWTNCPNCNGEITDIDTICAWCDEEVKPKDKSPFLACIAIGLALWSAVIYFVDWNLVFNWSW